MLRIINGLIYARCREFLLGAPIDVDVADLVAVLALHVGVLYHAPYARVRLFRVCRRLHHARLYRRQVVAIRVETAVIARIPARRRQLSPDILVEAIVLEISLTASLVGQVLAVGACIRVGDVVAQHAAIALDICLEAAVRRVLVAIDLGDDAQFLRRRYVKALLNRILARVVADFHRFEFIQAAALRIRRRESVRVQGQRIRLRLPHPAALQHQLLLLLPHLLNARVEHVVRVDCETPLLAEVT